MVNSKIVILLIFLHVIITHSVFSAMNINANPETSLEVIGSSSFSVHLTEAILFNASEM